MAESEEIFEPPMSNNERILMNILGMEGVEIEPPQSRIEKLLLAILEQGQSGGGEFHLYGPYYACLSESVTIEAGSREHLYGEAVIDDEKNIHDIWDDNFVNSGVHFYVQGVYGGEDELLIEAFNMPDMKTVDDAFVAVSNPTNSAITVDGFYSPSVSGYYPHIFTFYTDVEIPLKEDETL